MAKVVLAVTVHSILWRRNTVLGMTLLTRQIGVVFPALGGEVGWCPKDSGLQEKVRSAAGHTTLRAWQAAVMKCPPWAILLRFGPTITLRQIAWN